MRLRYLVLFLLLASVSPLWALKNSKHHRLRNHIKDHHKRTLSVQEACLRAGCFFVPNRASLLAQNALVDQLGLSRFQDKEALAEEITRGTMVPIVVNKYVTLSPFLPLDRAYVRPWTNDWLQEVGKDFYQQFHKSIQVNSAVRTMQVQRRLLRWNRNAAPVKGELASSHEAGATVDLERRRLSKPQRRFLQARLLYYVAIGKIIVEEEVRRESCFHTMVSRYVTQVEPVTSTVTQDQLDEEVADVDSPAGTLH